MSRQETIRRGMLGTWDTLRFIYQMGQTGTTSDYVKRFVLTVPLQNWNTILKQYWDYQDEEEETLRSVATQIDSLMHYGKLVGDCDDAAVMAVALCAASNLPCKVVAVRQPQDSEFSHVFVESAAPQQRITRLDPTAPINASYVNWERMVYPT